MIDATGGEGAPDVQSLEAVGLLHLPADLGHTTARDWPGGENLQVDGPLNRVQLRPPDDGILQQFPDLTFRLIEGKHIQKEYIVLHNQLPCLCKNQTVGVGIPDDPSEK